MTEISIRKAEIASATVSIRMLHVDGRKLTMGTFRQIPEECVFGLTGAGISLRGVPWGWVNYWWECDNNIPGFAHVVWQNGAMLRRSRLYSAWKCHCTTFITQLNLATQRMTSLLPWINLKDAQREQYAMSFANDELLTVSGNEPLTTERVDMAFRNGMNKTSDSQAIAEAEIECARKELKASTDNARTACNGCHHNVNASKHIGDIPPLKICGVPFGLVWRKALTDLKASIPQLFIST